MKTEVMELEDKAEKLKKFFHSQIYNDLPKEKRDLMMEQYDAMVLYSTKLRQRCELEGIKL